MEGLKRSYLIYKKQIRYRSDQMLNECDNIGAAEDYIDQEVDRMMTRCLLDIGSDDWQQMRAALYNAYYIRIMPEV